MSRKRRNRTKKNREETIEKVVISSESDETVSAARYILAHLHYIAIAMVILAMILFKASTTSIVHDEAFSYMAYVSSPIENMIELIPPLPNNHLLNSAAMRVMSHFFGISEISLRMPSILAFLGYVGVALLLVRKLENRTLRFPAFLLLLTNLYVVEFFGLARGYSHGAFMTLAIIFLLTMYQQKRRLVYMIGAIAASFIATAAVYSHIYLIPTTLAISGLILLARESNALRNGKYRNFLTEGTVAALLSALTLLPFYFPIKTLRYAGNLSIYSGKTGFWQDTVTTLVDSSLWSLNYIDPHMMVDAASTQLKSTVLYLVAVSILVASLLTIYRAYSEKEFNKALIPMLIILLVAIGNTMQEALFNGGYMLGRTALFLIPTFFVWLLFAFDTIQPKILATVPVYILTIICSLYFFSNFTTGQVRDWPFAFTINRAVEPLFNERKCSSITTTWYFEPELNYYTDKSGHQIPVYSVENHPELAPTADCFYLPKNSPALKENGGSVVSREGAKSVDEFSQTGMILITR